MTRRRFIVDKFQEGGGEEIPTPGTLACTWIPTTTETWSPNIPLDQVSFVEMCITIHILKAPVDKRCWEWGAKMVSVAREPLKEADGDESSNEEALDGVEPMWDRFLRI
uniref:Uncharacterized protein n=1 Tax=Nelumbo nucifera TaxID=4432 RepID=A0A822ZKC5_NELNU|nr:TPA_asm: hypothetical protein HUJ06_003557 [Nelumbo nucifera]